MKNLKNRIALTLLLFALVPRVALADRDIVYSARYYAPPGSRATSHFHLYRINPDGSGRIQLTFGAHDDENPLWSPTAKSILFIRDEASLCTVKASGGHITTIAAYPPAGFVPFLRGCRWMPDSRAVFVPSGNPIRGSTILDAQTGRVLGRPPASVWLATSPGGDAAYLDDFQGGALAKIDRDNLTILRQLPEHAGAGGWVTDDALIAVIPSEGDVSDRIGGFDENGTKLWMRGVHLIQSTNIDLGAGFPMLVAIPGDARNILIAVDVSTSTTRPDYDYYCANVDTGNAPPWLSEKQWVVFNKTGRYATSSARDLSQYGRAKDGRAKTVWTTDLEIGRDPMNTHPKPIVDGLVWVDGADWRR